MSGYCVICTDSFSASGQDISAIVCGHTFHRSCLTDWTSKSNTCPQCRLTISPKSIIRKLYFSANPDPQDDPELLKLHNAQLGAELRQMTDQVDALRVSMASQDMAMQGLKMDIQLLRASLEAEQTLVISVKRQLDLARAKNHAIDKLQAQLKATQKSLQVARQAQLSYEDVIYGSSSDGLSSIEMQDDSSIDNSMDVPSYSISNVDTDDSTQSMKNCHSDQMKVLSSNEAEEYSPLLADKKACDNYTAYQLSSMADDLQLLADADEGLEVLFGFTPKETKLDDKISSSERDGSTRDNAIIID